MDFLFQLSGEHPKLPKAEIKAVLRGEGIKYKILEEVKEGRLLLVETETKNLEFIRRLALTKKAARFISKSYSLEKLARDICRKIPENAKTFAVRATKEVEEKLGEKIKEKCNLEVNLENPDVGLVCFSPRGYYAGIKIPLQRNFEERKPQFRPYFSPTSMHPKLARCLVNLARVKKADQILDPFCGTGGILIEAAMMGMKVKGRDADDRAVRGCRENLDFYQLEGEVEKENALELKLDQKVDAIVTDLPYGRSSFLTEEPEELYEKFLQVARENLKSKKYLVMVLPEKYQVGIRNNFPLQESYKIYVHKSLSRKILVLRKLS